MTNKLTSTQIGFRLSLAGLGILTLGMLLIVFQIETGNNLLGTIAGGFFLAAGLVGIIGLITNIKGFSNARTAKKNIGIVLNLSLVIMLITLIAVNASDISKVLV